MSRTHPDASPRTASEIDAATPADRDRWVDTLRAGSLLVVVLGHWLMVSITPDGQITNALAVVPALQPLTWLLQVMPLFFLVGGVAHAHTLESLERSRPEPRGRYAAFFRARATRLLRPTLAFLAVWVVLGVVADLSGLTSRPGDAGRLARDALVTVPQLLWFVGIYLGACAFARSCVTSTGAGASSSSWCSWCWPASSTSCLSAAGPSSSATSTSPSSGWPCTSSGSLGVTAGSRPLAGGRWPSSVSAMGLAVAFGPYPTSMVGLPGEAVSNMAPPTAALLAQGIGICGLAVVLRPVMARVLARPRVWRSVVLGGPFAMTAFLWHLTALMTILLALRALGVVQPSVASWQWWLTRPLLFTVLAVVTGLLVAVFVRFDRGPRTAADAAAEPRGWVDPVAAVSAGVLFFGILIVSIVGVDVLGNRPVFFLVGDVTPIVGFAVLGAGLLLLRTTRPRAPRT
ncbi:acyltransferase [Terrabacter sp. 2TAF16]|uniref:acyltransferase family protein n=1 Tax=Terrabacter sp. 2TAF16 TaxID=3233008 RepID=UPI003F9B7D6A